MAVTIELGFYYGIVNHVTCTIEVAETKKLNTLHLNCPWHFGVLIMIIG